MEDVVLRENRFVSWKILLFIPGLGFFGGLFIAAALWREIARGDFPREVAWFSLAFCIVGLLSLIWYCSTEKNLYFSPTRNGLSYTRPFLKFLFPEKKFIGRPASVELRWLSKSHFILVISSSSSNGRPKLRMSVYSYEDALSIGRKIQELTGSSLTDHFAR